MGFYVKIHLCKYKYIYYQDHVKKFTMIYIHTSTDYQKYQSYGNKYAKTLHSLHYAIQND